MCTDSERCAELEAELETCRQGATSEHERYLRALADLDNYRKRVERDSDRERREHRTTIVRAFLPAIDNLERALQATPEDEDSLHRGLEIVLRQLQETLRTLGVSRLHPEGRTFDPARHEAVGTSGEDPGKAGRVVAVLEPGYELDRELIRPARVLVGGGNMAMQSEEAAPGDAVEGP